MRLSEILRTLARFFVLRSGQNWAAALPIIALCCAGILLPVSESRAQLTIVVENIPENTPHDASLFVAGSFNNWNPGEVNSKMTRRPDGTFTFRLPADSDSVQYKITRGNWSSVEGRENGRAASNRLYIKGITKPEQLRISIKSWEDLSAPMVGAYTLFLLLASMQGFILLVAVTALQNNNRSANRLLSVLLLIISVTILCRVAVYDRNIFNATPKIILISDLILFSYSPAFYLYIRKLLTVEGTHRKNFLHFVAPMVHLLSMLPLFWEDHQTFIDQTVDRGYELYYTVTAVIALIFNAFYSYKTLKLLIFFNRKADSEYSFEQNINYLYAVSGINLLGWFVWLAAFGVHGFGLLTGADTLSVLEKMMDAVWIVLSLTTFCMGYFAMRQAELFKLPDSVEEAETEASETGEISSFEPGTGRQTEPEKQPVLDRKMSDMRLNLSKLMDTARPYKNPTLTLAELADSAEITTHELSRLINEGFDKNFFEFVNDYRIREFKNLVKSNAHRNKTLLALAMEVGFNSKTAFNRSFKKQTGETPREFMKKVTSENEAV